MLAVPVSNVRVHSNKLVLSLGNTKKIGEHLLQDEKDGENPGTGKLQCWRKWDEKVCSENWVLAAGEKKEKIFFDLTHSTGKWKKKKTRTKEKLGKWVGEKSYIFSPLYLYVCRCFPVFF